MHKKYLEKKGLALIVIILFIGMSTYSAVGDSKLETDSGDISIEPLGNDEIIEVYFLGMHGKGDWFITDIQITFIYIDRLIDKIWYSITEDIEPDWDVYNNDPIIFTTEGNFWFQFKYLDNVTGNETIWPDKIPLKLDKSPPTVEIEKTVQKFLRKITYTAVPKDEHSGIERVKFYLDGEEKADLTSNYKYIFYWEKGTEPGDHNVTAVAFNFAGYNSSDSSDTTPMSAPYHNRVFSRILQLMHSFKQYFVQLLRALVRFPFMC